MKCLQVGTLLTDLAGSFTVALSAAFFSKDISSKVRRQASLVGFGTMAYVTQANSKTLSAMAKESST